jgi:hypothetical protein
VPQLYTRDDEHQKSQKSYKRCSAEVLDYNKDYYKPHDRADGNEPFPEQSDFIAELIARRGYEKYNGPFGQFGRLKTH